jgi:hypothetical protein
METEPSAIASLCKGGLAGSPRAAPPRNTLEIKALGFFWRRFESDSKLSQEHPCTHNLVLCMHGAPFPS